MAHFSHLADAEDIGHVQLTICIVLSHFVSRWSWLFLAQYVDSCGEIIRAARLEALVHAVRVMLEARATLFEPIKVMFLRIEWYILSLTEIACLDQFGILVHLVDVDEGWRLWEL